MSGGRESADEPLSFGGSSHRVHIAVIGVI